MNYQNLICNDINTHNQNTFSDFIELLEGISEAICVPYDAYGVMILDRQQRSELGIEQSVSARLPEDLSLYPEFEECQRTKKPVYLNCPDLFLYHTIIIKKYEENQEIYQLLLIKNTEQFACTTQNLPIGILKLDGNWGAVYANSYCGYLLGANSEELLNRGWVNFFDEKLKHELFSYLSNHKDVVKPFSSQVKVISPLGKTRILSVSSIAFHESNRKFDSLLLTFFDVTDQHEAEKSAAYLAEHDSVTGALNRQGFMRQMKALPDPIFKNGLLVFIDINDFKEINDVYGHKAGDQVLWSVAKRISSVIRSVDSLSRFGGDEFVIFIANISHASSLDEIAQKIEYAINGLISVNDRKISISSSIGLAWVPSLKITHDCSRDVAIECLIDSADQAMYYSKAHKLLKSKNMYKIFDNVLKDKVKIQKERLNEFNSSFLTELFDIHFQPIYTQDKTISSLEALLHTKRKLSYHSSNIELFETANLSEHRDDFYFSITRKAIKTFSKISTAVKSESLSLNLNIDISQMQDYDFVDSISEMCKKYHIDPSRVYIEITEILLESKIHQIQINIEELSKRGFKISMDDFGTGYSSLKRLLSYDFKQIKIDKFFIQNINISNKRKNILEAMIAIGKSLNLNILAEGVENKYEYEFCRKLNVDLYQGFIFSKAIDEHKIISLLESTNAQELKERDNECCTVE